MNYSIIKIIISLKSPILWLYLLVLDRAQLSILGGEFLDRETEKLLIPIRGNCDNDLFFGFATKSNEKIEIKNVYFDYAAFDGVIFSDPQNIGFFKLGTSNDTNFPFRLSWSGSAFIDKNTIQAFALLVTVNVASYEQLVKITVNSQKHKIDLGGFPSTGRIQATVFMKTVAFTNEKYCIWSPS